MQPIPEPSLAELGRTLDRIERDLGRRLDEMKTAFETAFEHAVTAEVYEAHRQAMADQIAGALDKVADLRSDFEDMRAELVEEKKERRADRRMYIGAFLSLLVLVAGAALLAALRLK
jgi:hypothetical protein